MTVEVRPQPFDAIAELQRHERGVLCAPGQFGACVSFIGSMRDFNDGAPVQTMMLEHYPGMTEKHLQALTVEAQTRWSLREVLVLHRVGRVAPGDPIVLVAVWAAHRAAAFDACRYLIDELKSRAPFWKKEERPDGTHWVSHNTPRV
jgi:molybdopterin synthase catalytic subunit